ncbi:MAG: ferrous iron transport protein B [Desulfomonile tiedjei]|nr:ferrous iron transport protein B [Desulfomonile tiedjei]
MRRTLTVALSGNPNAGKTTIFNAITGARQHVGNWPGVTVEKKEGTTTYNGQKIHVVDLPGTYSLTAYSLEEIIARKFIVESPPDVVIDVVDASNLERNLYLAVQLLEMGAKVVIALNMIDVAQGRGIKIDVPKLSELLGVPVVSTNGKKGIGLDELLQTAIAASDAPQDDYRKRSFIRYGAEVEEELEIIEGSLAASSVNLDGLSSRWVALKLVEGDTEITERLSAKGGLDGLFKQAEASRAHLTDIFEDTPEIILTDARYGFISGAMKRSVHLEATDRVHLSQTIDTVLTNRLLGPVILLSVLYLVYMFTFQGSEPLVKLFEAGFKSLGNLVENALPEGLFRSLLVSGVIHGVGGVLGFTPLIAFMFLAIAILEDTGYMARIAFMLDRVLRGFGLHGASMLALMVSGGLAGGCAVPGIMATRTMKEPKERLVTILVAPLMNCGAKLPVYALLIGAFFPDKKAQIMFLLTFVSWGMALLAAKVIRATVLSGPSAPFVLELPPYRVPTAKGLLIHTWERTWMYIKKAGTVILAVSIVLWAMMTFPSLSPEAAKPFDEKVATLTADFLKDPAVRQVLPSEEALGEFERFRERLTRGTEPEFGANSPLFGELALVVDSQSAGLSPESTGKKPRPEIVQAAEAYQAFRTAKSTVESEKQMAHLRNTIGGRIGIWLERVTGPLGFDWRTNVALVGGFVAKEVVVATLGTAYSLGEVDTHQSEGLSERLRHEPGWTPLLAFTLIMFVMLYNPCFTTLVVIRRESGKWRWTVFAMVYTTVFAYLVALLVHTVGSILRIGVA